MREGGRTMPPASFQAMFVCAKFLRKRANKIGVRAHQRALEQQRLQSRFPGGSFPATRHGKATLVVFRATCPIIPSAFEGNVWSSPGLNPAYLQPKLEW